MTTKIFERETEVGKCRCELSAGERWAFAEPDYAAIVVHTIASVNGHRGMLCVEHQCYLRRGGELPDQPWIKPNVFLEPAVGSREEIATLAADLHERYVEQVQKEFPVEYLV